VNLSFRTKLIVAMTLVVVCVTGSTLYVASKRVRETYQHLFEDQFQQQLRFFSSNRIAQLQQVAQKCETLAKQVRVVTALEEALEENDPDIIYDVLEVELDELMKNFGGPSQSLKKLQETMRRLPPHFAKHYRDKASQDRNRGKPPPDRERELKQPPPPQQGSMISVAVVDRDGKFIVPRKQRPNFMLTGRAQNRNLFAGKPLAESVKEQEIGYLPINKESDKSQLREMIVTPLVNEATGETLGALVLGFTVRDFGENEMYQFSDRTLLSGIWLDGKIYSATIPDELRQPVAARVAEEVKLAETGESLDTVVVDGAPHRLFFKVLNPSSPFPPAVQVCLYSMREALAEQAALRNEVLGYGSAALLVGIGCILFLSHGFSKPVEELARATQLVRDGDFTVKVPVKTKDELGTLAMSFNEMTADLALKERYKTVLAQVTDKDVAEQLISGEMSLGGEVRQVSVLFCDIRGFTALTENMPPGEVITMLNEHMTAMNRVVHKHYGMVDKFVGDLIMGVFGAPKSYGNDALHAVKCALKMIEERKRLNETTTHSFEIGIGVASGEVVAGCMGSEDRLNYTVLGERVNLASRLCSKAGRTELLIDETTYKLLPEGFIAEATEPLPLKGFSSLVPAYRLTEVNGAEMTDAANDAVRV
jgi:class 3 adenylate cyclase